MLMRTKPLVAMLGALGLMLMSVTAQADPAASSDTVSGATAPASAPTQAQSPSQAPTPTASPAPQAASPDTTSSATQAPGSAPEVVSAASASAPAPQGPGPVVGFTPANANGVQAQVQPEAPQAQALSPEAQLAQRLDITPEQMPLWNAYMQAKAQLDEPVKLTFKAPQSVQQSLEQRLAMQEARLIPQQRLVAARAQLINAMTPAQRFALDMFETGRGIGPVIITPDMPAWHILHPTF